LSDIVDTAAFNPLTDCIQCALNLIVQVTNRFTPADFTIIGFNPE
jgi:hypothetical protein